MVVDMNGNLDRIREVRLSREGFAMNDDEDKEIKDDPGEGSSIKMEGLNEEGEADNDNSAISAILSNSPQYSSLGHLLTIELKNKIFTSLRAFSS